MRPRAELQFYFYSFDFLTFGAECPVDWVELCPEHP